MDIAKGPDGNVWFTRQGADNAALVRVTSSGTFTEFPLTSVPLSLVTGSDGNIWLTAPAFGTVAKVVRFIPP